VVVGGGLPAGQAVFDGYGADDTHLVQFDGLVL
jgi:hypothetical protein